MNKLWRRWRERRSAKWLKIEPVRREVSRLTVAEWRADRGWVATAASMLHNPQLRQMLDAVANSAPGFEVLPLGVNAHERIVHQARQEGYTMALANLMALGVEQPLPEPLEALFEEPTKP